MVETLTANEQRVLDAIAAHFAQHNRMPTHAELAATLGFKSKNSSWQYLRQLERKGYVHIDAYKQRGVMVSVPIVGHVACGKPVWVESDLEGYAQVDQRFTGTNPNEFFLLRADGDSMDRAETTPIEAGDLPLVRHQADADSGEIVVAQIDGEATVKVYRPATGYAVLLPRSSNPAHQPIIVTEKFGIYGVVRLRWHGRDYRIRKVGYHHQARQGRVWVHVLAVSTEAMAFKLRHHPEDLSWILEEVSDGTAD